MKKRSALMILGGMIFVYMVNFISAASSAWTVQSVLNSWASAGIFKYVLPFLLIFALIFGLLQKSNILGDNKGVHAIIAAALGLLSLVGDYFPNFLEKFAPNLAVAVSVVLAAIILLGVFYDPKDEGRKKIVWVIFVVAVIFGIWLIADTFSGYSGIGYNIWDNYGPGLITLIILIIFIWAVVSVGGSKDKKE